jgi:hypothetical protein
MLDNVCDRASTLRGWASHHSPLLYDNKQSFSEASLSLFIFVKCRTAMNWLDEDPELLRTALEIIESWDGESSVNGVAVTSPSSSTEETDSNNDEAGGEDGGELIPKSAAASPLAAAANAIGGTASRSEGDMAAPSAEPTPNRVSAVRRARKPSATSTLQKRRDEILYLRHKITFMESQLATLHKQDVDGDDNTGSMTNGVDTTLVVTWHDIASRQLRLRQKAELEQAKLRGLLETQMKVARGLIKLTQRVRGIEGDESFPTAKLAMNASDIVSKEEQCAHVDELYHCIDEAFSFAKFHDGTLKFIDVDVQDQGDDDVFIDMRDAWALPFEIDEVTGAIWAFMGKRVVQKGRQENALTVRVVDHACIGDSW